MSGSSTPTKRPRSASGTPLPVRSLRFSHEYAVLARSKNVTVNPPRLLGPFQLNAQTLGSLSSYGLAFNYKGPQSHIVKELAAACANPKFPPRLKAFLSPDVLEATGEGLRLDDDWEAPDGLLHAVRGILQAEHDIAGISDGDCAYGELSIERRVSMLLVRFFPCGNQWTDYSDVNLPLPHTTAIECSLPRADFTACIRSSAFAQCDVGSPFALPVFALESKFSGTAALMAGVPQLACVAKPVLDLYRILGLPDEHCHMFSSTIDGTTVTLHLFESYRTDNDEPYKYKHIRLNNFDVEVSSDRLALAAAMMAIAKDSLAKREELVTHEIPFFLLKAAAEGEGGHEEDNDDFEELDSLKAPLARLAGSNSAETLTQEFMERWETSALG
ncbi:hypothetical protein HDU87_007168 [Geranomyces variabilis]|uniref:Uncharacterized protein n=1 Tax=Geranomyces variabilis TaxID=109894 RepID=A0AAD5TEQ4_9FUNG|nr:hypothetical protein HDU87_007168 [Geranomyces variabilis]